MTTAYAESALPAGEDPRRHARLLEHVRDAVLSGARVPVQPRPLIEASWRRVRGTGLDPAARGEVAPLPAGELERRRRESGLAAVVPLLRSRLLPVAESAGQILVVTDPAGRVLWREGSSGVRHRADGLGFVEGSAWDESAVGTNAIGTCLVVGAPVHVFAAEHYADSHRPWTCAAAPLRDPADGRLLGAVDLSGPAATVHATTVALVDAVARLAELQLQTAHLEGLSALRAVAAPVLARLGGRALVVSHQGWTAGVTGTVPVPRVVLPDGLAPGQARLPGLGACLVEPLPGGWLLRVLDGEERDAPARRVVLDLAGATPRLEVSGAAGTLAHPLSPRHAELLLALAVSRGGRTATELAQDLFGDPTRTVTVRAEVSRLRRVVGGLVRTRPYRLADDVDVDLRLPEAVARLLPPSSAPVVEALRASPAPGTAPA